MLNKLVSLFKIRVYCIIFTSVFIYVTIIISHKYIHSHTVLYITPCDLKLLYVNTY